MGKDAVEGNLAQQLRDIKRRISALERQQQDVGDLSEIAGGLTMGDGNVIIDEDGIKIVEGSAGGKIGQYLPSGLSFLDSDGVPSGHVFQYVNLSSGYRIMKIKTKSLTDALHSAQIIIGTEDSDGTDTTYLFFDGQTGLVTLSTGRFAGIPITETGAITGGNKAIDDDSVYRFTPACARGVLILRGPGAGSTEYAMVTYAATAGTAYAYAWVNGTNTVITTGALTGTTGTDGKLTISAHTDGKIYIENRRGGSRAVAWNILAGV